MDRLHYHNYFWRLHCFIGFKLIKESITNLLDNVSNKHNLTNDILKLYPHIAKIFIGHHLNDISNLTNLQLLHIENNDINENKTMNTIELKQIAFSCKSKNLDIFGELVKYGI